MKRISTLLFIMMIPLIIMAQSSSIRRLFRSCDQGKEVTRVHVPHFVLHMASWFMDDKDARHIVKDIRSVYLLVSENKEFSSQSDFPSGVVRELQRKDFNQLLVANDKGEKVTILLREKSRNRKEMVIAVDGNEDVVLYLKGKLDLQELFRNENMKIGGINLHGITATTN